MTKKQFLNLTLKDVSQIYVGKRNCCRCGCGGTYVTTSHTKEPRSEVNDKKVLNRLNRAQNLVRKGADYDNGNTYFDVESGKDRSITVYLNE